MQIFIKLLKLLGFYKNRKKDCSESTTSVVITGVENSPKWGSCSGALKDCDTFEKIISEASDKYDIVMLKDKQATRTAWKTAIANAVKKPLAIIFYSGHGGTDKNHVYGKGKNEIDGIDEFLCLYDGAVLDDDIWDIISQAAGRVFLIFDCCHSQTMFRTARDGDTEHAVEPAKTNIDFKKYISDEKNTDGFSMLCWSGCEDNNVSLGSSDGGVFTNYIKKYFKPGKSYSKLWNDLKSDKNLNSMENIQMTELGNGFQAKIFGR